VIATAERVPRTAAPPTDPGLEACDALLAEHLEAVRRTFGPAGLGVIDLPTLPAGQLVREQIRVCAVLYWTSEIEQTGLLPMIEAIAEGVMRGTIVEPLGGAIPELSRFWRSREYRFTAPERLALFARIFGSSGDANAPFQQQFQSLIHGLVAIGRTGKHDSTSHLEAQISVLAHELGATLTTQGAGIAAFAARNIVDQIRTALRLLQHPDLQRALGGGPPWMLVARHAPRLIRREVSPDRHVARALAGLRVIAWVANEAAAIEGGTLRVDRSAPVIREAEAWSAASGVL
jgi:hypothetical protein